MAWPRPPKGGFETKFLLSTPSLLPRSLPSNKGTRERRVGRNLGEDVSASCFNSFYYNNTIENVYEIIDFDISTFVSYQRQRYVPYQFRSTLRTA